MKKRLFMLVIGILAATLTIEFYLQSTDPDLLRTRFFGTYLFRCFEKGTYFWMKLQNNKDCVLQTNTLAFPNVLIQTNSMGIRSPEITVPKPANTIRILFLGDSFTMGWGVKEEDSFPRIVEKLLQKKFTDKKIEVINAGLVNTGQTYAMLFLKNEGLNLEPDIVIDGFYPANDVFDLQYDTLWENINSEGLPEKSSSRLAYVHKNGAVRAIISPLQEEFPFINNSRLLLILAGIFSPIEHKGKPEILRRICFYQEDCHDTDEAKTKIKKIFRNMNSTLSQKGIKFFVMRLPAEFLIYDESRFKYRIPLALNPDDKKKSMNEFEQFFTKQKIDFFDLLPVFLENKDKELFYQNDDHWNNQGHAVAAQAMSNYIENVLK